MIQNLKDAIINANMTTYCLGLSNVQEGGADSSTLWEELGDVLNSVWYSTGKLPLSLFNVFPVVLIILPSINCSTIIVR